MPKITKPAAKRKPASVKPAPRKKIAAPKSSAPVKTKPAKKNPTPEYAEYLERYALHGTGRPKLSQADFDRYDDELLDLLALESERGLNDEQAIQLQELEYLLVDSEQ